MISDLYLNLTDLFFHCQIMASFNECPLCSSFEMQSSNVKLIHIHVYMLDSHSTKILKSNMICDDRIINYLSVIDKCLKLGIQTCTKRCTYQIFLATNSGFILARQQEETPKRSSRLYESVSQSFTQDSQVDSLSSDCEGVSLNVQDILLEAYRQIGDPDGVYGCGAGRLADPVSRFLYISLFFSLSFSL